MQSLNTVSRRHFVEGAGLVAGAALATTAMASIAKADESPSSEGCTYPDSIAWNAIYDVIVIGFGGAGATAARLAADSGAQVLLVDSAPEGHEGGNTRYCAQLIAYGENQEELMKYYSGLAWKMNMDEEAFEVFTTAEAGMKDFFRDNYGVEPVAWKESDTAPAYVAASIAATTPEYPNLDGGETFDYLSINDGIFNAALWRTMRNQVKERSDQITVWLDSPAIALVQDPDTKTIVGAKIEHDGEEALVRANNGVVLTCGGFENNQQMIQDYLGAPRLAPLGSTYNVGDGIRMVEEIGADLWHMNNYESLGVFAGNALYRNEADGRARLTFWESIANGSIIVVGDDGGRYQREDESNRHGHIYENGVYRIPTVQYSPHVIFDQTKYDWFMDNFDTLNNTEFLSNLVSSDTLAGLAELIDADPDVLQKPSILGM